MSKIIILTSWDKNSLGKMCEYADYGINTDTDEVVILPQERIEYFVQECGAKLDTNTSEWYIEDNREDIKNGKI